MPALSLKCNTCGVQLKSVAEAQQHGEASGHSDFAESTEAVLNLTCVTCGKPCRSETEKEIHNKRTGHSEFVDKTNEQAQTVDTATEMKAIEVEMKEEAGFVVKSDDEKKNGDDDAMDASSSEEQVEPEVDEGLVIELEAMGFSRNKAVRALHATGTSSVEQAVNWIIEHENDADLDSPLLVPKSRSAKKVPLSKEEARVKAEELRKSMAAKKAKEDEAG